MNHKCKIVSLFSGIGGFEEGLKQSNLNFEIIFSSEIDKYAQKSYISNFEHENIYGDIKKINEKDIPDHDFLIAGFPCQSFSIAGKRLGFKDQTKGTLFFDIKRILQEKKPKFILLENVKNLVSHENSKTIKIILRTLETIGYTVDFSILNSKDFGVPQSRERTYIFGILNGETTDFANDKNKKVDMLKQELNKEGIQSLNFFNEVKSFGNQKTILDIIETSVDKKYFLRKKEVNNFIKTLNKEKFINTNKSNTIVKLLDIPRDLHNDNERQRRVYSTYGIAPTVLARSDSAKIFVENYEYQIRKLTPIENLKIQGFSADFIKNISSIGMSDTQLYKQSGNAVTPPVITAIANNIVENYIEKQTTNKFLFVDLFSGIGGFRIALEKNGGKCIFSSDIDPYARQTYLTNFGEEPSGDIMKIKSEDIPNHDILTAGFPCQPFSLAGKRLGFEDTRGTLFFEVARILKDKTPSLFILENVSGIVNHDNGNTLAVIEKTLKDLNYEICWKTLNAKDYGVPQNRNRWYCVGINKSGKYKNIDLEKVFPEKTELNILIDDIVEDNVSEDYIISDIAKENIKKHIGNYLSKKENHNMVFANNIRPSKVSFRSDGISPCLTAKMGTGGNNVPVIVDKNRKLTEYECLKLMGFPESYQIKHNYSQSYKQIGNSIVVTVVDKIVQNIVSQFRN